MIWFFADDLGHLRSSNSKGTGPSSAYHLPSRFFLDKKKVTDMGNLFDLGGIPMQFSYIYICNVYIYSIMAKHSNCGANIYISLRFFLVDSFRGIFGSFSEDLVGGQVEEDSLVRCP